MPSHAQPWVFRKWKVQASAAAIFLLASIAFSAAQTQALRQEPWKKFKIQFTPQEIEWIGRHPQIRLGFDPAWPPFSFRDANGEVRGIDLDLLARIGQRLGIKFEPARADTWDEIYQKILNGEIDVVSGITRTESRENNLLFTSPYISSPVAVITRQEAPFVTSLHNLKNVTLASPRGYVTTERLAKDYPALPLIQTSTLLEALTLISKGKADVAISNLANTSYLIKSAGLTNLKIAGISDYHFELCLAVRKDWPELCSVLQKALNSLDDAERRAIFDPWTAVEYFPHADWSRVWRIGSALLLGAAVLFSLFAWWNRRLATELAERKKAEAALKATRDRLQELNEEKTRFMRMAAHDLNNPLSAIVMSTHAIAMDENTPPDLVRKSFSTIRENARRMSHLIKNLLNADKIEHGQMQLRDEPIDLQAPAREATDALRPYAENKKIRVEFIGPPLPARVRGDRNAMFQVLENLISNAIKFTPPGKSVRVKVAAGEGRARVEVHDEGPGVSEQDRLRLFMKFATLSARPTANESSNGLGLSIAKNLTESMGGSIRCASRPGESAVFVVEFAAAG